MVWLDGQSPYFLSGEFAQQSYLEYTIFDYQIGFTYRFTKTSKIGIAVPDFERNRKYYVFLYKARNTEIYVNPVRPGYYYRFKSTEAWRKYNALLFGTKDYWEVPEYGNARGGQGSVAPIAVSSTTLTAYGNSFGIRGSADFLEKNPTSWLKSIASQSYASSDAAFRREVADSLRQQGYSQLEIEAYLRARDDRERGHVKQVADARVKAALDELFGSSGTSGSGTSGRGSGGGPSNGSNNAANFVPISYPDVQTRLVVRMPNGFRVPSSEQLSAITKPAMHQTFIDDKGQVQSYTYTFEYIPQNIQYSNLGSEWIEIPRAENFAFVDWGRFQLMRVSMSWIVAMDRVDGSTVVPDGMMKSIDANLLSLREMAQRKYPVTIVNMDELLSVRLNVEGEPNQIRSISGMQFVISDLSITASRRTTVDGAPETPSRIAVAQCQMTLQEVPIEQVPIISLPTLNIPFAPPKSARPPSAPMDPTLVLASDVAVPSPDTSYATNPPTTGSST